MSEHNAADMRVVTRPVWRTFLLMFLTSALYRTYWAWRTNIDLVEFARERPGVVSREQAVRVNPAANALFTFLLLPGAALVVVGVLFAVGSVPSEYGIAEPKGAELWAIVGAGLACLVPGLVAQLRTAARIRRARRLAGLAPSVDATGRWWPLAMAVEVIGVPAAMFAMQQSLNDLWTRYPPLLDEDLHGELAPEDRRAAAIARRPALHEQRLQRVAVELERPNLVPWVTIGFATLCVVAYGYQLWFHGPFPDTRDIERVGGLREGLDGTWWRFWTANVLHASVDHLSGNVLAWSFVATMVERVVGHLRLLLLIVAGAAGSSVGALQAHPDEVGLGASGVVFAAFALAAMVDPLARRAVGKLGWSLVALGLGLSTFAPGVSSGAHVGGALTGFAVGGVIAFVWRVKRPLSTAADRGALRLPPVDRSAPLAPDRELTIAERLAHLDRRLAEGGIAPLEHDRLTRALLARG